MRLHTINCASYAPTLLKITCELVSCSPCARQRAYGEFCAVHNPQKGRTRTVMVPYPAGALKGEPGKKIRIRFLSSNHHLVSRAPLLVPTTLHHLTTN